MYDPVKIELIYSVRAIVRQGPLDFHMKNMHVIYKIS